MAFSPTDVIPIRLWAKFMVIGESVLSPAIATLVLARAINEL